MLGKRRRWRRGWGRGEGGGRKRVENGVGRRDRRREREDVRGGRKYDGWREGKGMKETPQEEKTLTGKNSHPREKTFRSRFFIFYFLLE